MQYKSDVNVPWIVTLGLAGALLLVAIIIGVQAWVAYQDQTVFAAESSGGVARPLAEMRKAQLENLARSGLSSDRKTWTIPIEQAMKYLVENNGRMPATRPTTRPTTQN
jgi:uncharacterized protein HemX